ncbi:SET domain-containing protein [Hypoxylon sp. NC1633]|nr:SET domain-containing protein [Hypoxylon sp. NC1633]
MRRGYVSLTDLPAWCVLNDVNFIDVKPADIKGRGYGLVAERDLVTEGDKDEPTVLLTVPRELILCAEGVEEYGKENKEFRQLLDAAGHRSARGDIMLFLLAQLVLSSPDYKGGLGPSTAWTQYFSLLPTHVPTPTLWTESELSYLKGTSLDPAVSVKLIVLTNEFEDLRAKVAELSYWNELFLPDGMITIQDWILLDALFRSRSLGLPKSGESMVPCLDLVNHSSQATAHFDETSNGDAVLYLREGCQVTGGGEITIDYGQDKSPAEMLFSYGFIDLDSTARSLTLPLEPLDDDPLAPAKLHAFGTPPKLELTSDETGEPRWTAPFVYLMCLNEEDGLEFKILQETDGSRHLTMLWQDVDITQTPDKIEELILNHDLHQIFQLRAITVIVNIIQQKLQEITNGPDEDEAPQLARAEIWQAISYLKSTETSILERSLHTLDEQSAQLLQEDAVLEYLKSMGSDENLARAEAANDGEDFS